MDRPGSGPERLVSCAEGRRDLCGPCRRARAGRRFMAADGLERRVDFGPFRISESKSCRWRRPTAVTKWRGPPAFLAEVEGRPLKNIVARAGEDEAVGELLVTRHGLEGGALYQLGRTLRGMAPSCLGHRLEAVFQRANNSSTSWAANPRTCSPPRRARGSLARRTAALLRLCPGPLRQRPRRPGEEFPARATRTASARRGDLQRRRCGVAGADGRPDAAPSARRLLRGGNDRLGGADGRLPAARLLRHRRRGRRSGCSRFSEKRMSPRRNLINLHPCSFRCASATWR